MSVEALNLVLNHSKAKGRAKLVLIGIANHFGDNGAWPSIETLARYTNESPRSVKRDIQVLIELGELVVEVNAAPMNSQYKTNRYWITVDSGVSAQVSRGVSSGKSGVTPVGTQTIIKNHKESDTRPSRISEDFSVSEAMRKWAETNHPDVDIDKATLNFVDYWLTKPKNNTKLDWVRTWQTWIRNTRPEQKQGNRATENKSVLDEFRKKYGSR